MTYHARACLAVNGYFSFEVEADNPIQARQLAEDHIDLGGDDEEIEIDWDSSRDYEIVRIETDDGTIVQFPPEQTPMPAQPQGELLRQHEEMRKLLMEWVGYVRTLAEAKLIALPAMLHDRTIGMVEAFKLDPIIDTPDHSALELLGAILPAAEWELTSMDDIDDAEEEGIRQEREELRDNINKARALVGMPAIMPAAQAVQEIWTPQEIIDHAG